MKNPLKSISKQLRDYLVYDITQAYWPILLGLHYFSLGLTQ